ncbi:MAG: hypothetical protein ACD_58C00094G0003 [uncultured bacterium]|nr:MAG: hypothetical protein ACD_58C00094G0003 [uncultured bacterium]
MSKRVKILIILLVVLVLSMGGYLVYDKLFSKDAKDSDSSSSDTTKENQTKDQPSDSGKKDQDPNQYNWSTMKQGPYKDKVSYAIGSSLTSWTDSSKILAEHASVPDVLYKDGIIYIYFVDVSKDGVPEQTGLMTSSDQGQTWSNKQNIIINGIGDKVVADPAPYLMEDGRIRLYYFDISKTMIEGTEKNTIYSAISSDGINFTQEEGARFAYPNIFDPDVIKVGDTWRLYVGSEEKVLSATSIDGLTFTYEGIAYSNGSIPNVVYENNLYYLFTGGINISTSSDGKTFTKTSNRFDPGKPANDPGVAKISDGKYILVYKTSDIINKPSEPNNPSPTN